jgi:hypothetical protein
MPWFVTVGTWLLPNTPGPYLTNSAFTDALGSYPTPWTVAECPEAFPYAMGPYPGPWAVIERYGSLRNTLELTQSPGPLPNA